MYNLNFILYYSYNYHPKVKTKTNNKKTKLEHVYKMQ